MFREIQGKPLDERRRISTKIISKYPERIPVIVDRYPQSALGRRELAPDIPKHKFLIHRDYKVSSFQNDIRSNIKLDAQQSLFLFVENHLVTNSDTMGSVYDRHHNPDGFLYIIYTVENTFGY
jgi:GABA(A) receptor-associated protein